jgi:hypothetical protein
MCQSWPRRVYQGAATESQKDWGGSYDGDPEGYVTVSGIRDGKIVHVRMKRKERDALYRQQSDR